MIFGKLSFSNLSIGKKLFSGFITLIVITTAMSAYSIYSLKAIKDNAAKTEISNQIGRLLETAKRNRLTYMINGDEQAMKANGENIDNMQVIVQQQSSTDWKGDTKNKFETLAETIDSFQQLRDVYYEKSLHSNALANTINADDGQHFFVGLQKTMRDSAVDNGVREKLFAIAIGLDRLHDTVGPLIAKPTDDTLTDFDKAYKDADSLYSASIPQLPDAEKAQVVSALAYIQKLKMNVEAYYSAAPEAQRAADSMVKGADSLNSATVALIKAQEHNNDQVITDTITLISVLSVVAVIAGLLAAGGITRQITRPISENLALAERITSGDLTSEVSSYSTDELGKLTQTMGAMNARLCDMITGIRESVSHLASASSQIAAGNMDLASRTEQQSAAVVETAASMEELTSTVRLNADNALQASKLAASATHDARKGGEIVNQVVLTMNGIGDSSKKITDIISVINSIAFQTNILALNAAVEAARAGEQGRGFAVVAGEVRTLAQRSANAAKEIESLINDSVTRISTGTELVSRAGASMEDIVQSVIHVSQLIDEISTSSIEQSQGIEQIGKAVTEMDSTTQQNATLVQESSAAAISLEQQAKKLGDMVAIFKVKIPHTNERNFDGLLTATKTRKSLVSPTRNNTVNEEWTSF
ncbi:methyl-accepting chemotaxis protein [Hafnia psychrotolerans]|uniref:Methyl-accepting chemotaxis protein n=2 Tax=Hafnia psychrotolerans TaxID=1477018 RepID=A0ABQ1GG27_9GAMM|nr:methyl-accepting chemotaxis protein [Hafnia psychrotolerans]